MTSTTTTRRRRPGAFTLAEVMIGATIGSFVLVGVLSAFLMLGRSGTNIVAYTLGAWHFHPRSEWLATFEQAGFELVQETKNNLLITTFILRKHGTAS